MTLKEVLDKINFGAQMFNFEYDGRIGNIDPYPVIRPRPLDGSSKGGKWEVVEDNNGKLQEALDYWGERWKKHGR